MEVVVTQNEVRKRFEAVVNDKLALIEYIKTKDKIYLTHTEVPNELEGQGIASRVQFPVSETSKIWRNPMMDSPDCRCRFGPNDRFLMLAFPRLFNGELLI